MAPRKTASLPWTSRRIGLVLGLRAGAWLAGACLAGACLVTTLGGMGGQRGRDHLNRQVGAVALAEAAQDAVVLLEDRVVAEYERALGADVDADVAALAEDRVPGDVLVVDPAHAVVVAG